MELINKEDAVALIKAEMDKIRTHSLVDGTARINLRLAKNIIEDMPTINLDDYVPKDFHDKTCEAMAKIHQEEIADMVSVVRCKECRWAKPNQEGDYDCKCHIPIFRVSADDYCSMGERKSDE